MTSINGIFQPLQQPAKAEALQTMSMPELYDTAFYLPPPIIEGFLYSGLQILAGSPKIGKSFFVLQLAYHVAKGDMFFNHQTNKCGVLYLALEDKFYRLQQRLCKMFALEAVPNLHMAVTANTLESGLEEQLAEFLATYSDVRLVIIDTMQRVRSKKDEQLSYSRDYTACSRLKELADKHNICLLVVHHTRKQGADDIFEKISGTNGLLGSADGAMILDKENRSADIATLAIVGRDQADQQLTLKFDRSSCQWELIKAEVEAIKAKADPLLDTIAQFITPARPSWNGTATELAAALNVKMAAHVLTRKLNTTAAQLEHDYGICYHFGRSHLQKTIILKLLAKQDTQAA